MSQEFQSLLQQDNLSEILKKQSNAKTEVTLLQNSLYQLGFAEALKWEQFGADGDFGNATAAALSLFGTENQLPFDGEKVSRPLAKAIAEKLTNIDHLRLLNSVLATGTPESSLFHKSNASEGIVALQTILNDLGYEEQLNWSKWGADGDYGGSTTAAVQAFATSQSISSDGKKVSKDLLEAIVSKASSGLGPQWTEVAQASANSRRRIVLPSGFKSFRIGVYHFGNHRPEAFIESAPPQLRALNMSESLIRVMVAVSVNEGNLDAVNTWDNSFMTFGMFQWTLGAKDAKGELPALLKKIKAKDASVFQQAFGQYGIDISDNSTNSTYGYLTLNGQLLNTRRRKELLRTDEWAVRFFEAGQDQNIQAVQVEHAASRLLNFYWKERLKTTGDLLSDVVTSEFGVALLLDNHVNRPGYVRRCVDKAMETMQNQNPSTWETAEEEELIKAYLRVRKTYPDDGNPDRPMTDAAKRGDRNIKLVKQGKLKIERGSFVYDATKSRSLLDNSTTPKGYIAEDYPEILEDKSEFPG